MLYPPGEHTTHPAAKTPRGALIATFSTKLRTGRGLTAPKSEFALIQSFSLLIRIRRSIQELACTRLRMVTLAAAFALSACTMIPEYERPAAPVAAQFPGATTHEANMTAADLAWSDFFKDARLKQLIDAALANNRDLRIAALNVEQRRAQYRITRSASFPEVDIASDYTRQRASGVANSQLSASIGTSA